MKIFIALLMLVLLSSCEYNNADTDTESRRSPSGTRTAVTQNEKAESGVAPIAENNTQGAAPSEKILSSAYTRLLDKTPARVENINIACGAINGIALYPWGSFSFNDTVGHRSEENGYRDARVIVDGHSEQGCGGGVCQVSSTLYMAARDAGLQIDERHPHSESVSYAPDGGDATVVFGEKDLRFTNNTENIIMLYIWTDGNGVFSEIVQKPLDNNG